MKISLLKPLPPPPFVIFSGKLEVSKCNGYKSSNDQEDDEYDEEDAVNGVDPVTPNTGKEVVQLDVDGTERKKTRHGHLRYSTPVPWELRDLPGILSGADWRLELYFAVFTSDTA